jgi:hypothetical protein
MRTAGSGARSSPKARRSSLDVRVRLRLRLNTSAGRDRCGRSLMELFARSFLAACLCVALLTWVTDPSPAANCRTDLGTARQGLPARMWRRIYSAAAKQPCLTAFRKATPRLISEATLSVAAKRLVNEQRAKSFARRQPDARAITRPPGQLCIFPFQFPSYLHHAAGAGQRSVVRRVGATCRSAFTRPATSLSDYVQRLVVTLYSGLCQPFADLRGPAVQPHPRGRLREVPGSSATMRSKIYRLK